MSDERLFSCLFFCNFHLIIQFFYIFLVMDIRVRLESPTQTTRHRLFSEIDNRRKDLARSSARVSVSGSDSQLLGLVVGGVACLPPVLGVGCILSLSSSGVLEEHLLDQVQLLNVLHDVGLVGNHDLGVADPL